jgi:two-component system, cell cycle sensor histidine kinase and response regulator CckA
MLGVILGHAEMAMEEVDKTLPLYADLEEISKAGRRSADITRQLLAFARKQTIAPRVLDLNATVEGILKMLRRLIGEEIELAWQPGNSLWPVKMDPSQIDQILANLCVNARDSITGIGTITVATKNISFTADDTPSRPDLLLGDYVRISVTDSGSGMTRETLAHIFEPFFTTKGVGQGTGLGLATVYGAIKQNNGCITADSEPGRGTTFTIYLPRHADEDGRSSTEPPAVTGFLPPDDEGL